MSTKTQRSFGILRVTSCRAIAQPETELFRRDRWPSMTAVMASPTAIARRFLLNAISPSVNQSNRTPGARQLEDCYAQEISSRLHQFAQAGRRRFGPRSLARRCWNPGVSGRARSSVSGVCGLAGTTCYRRTGCGAVHGQSDPRHRGSPGNRRVCGNHTDTGGPHLLPCTTPSTTSLVITPRASALPRPRRCLGSRKLT